MIGFSARATFRGKVRVRGLTVQCLSRFQKAPTKMLLKNLGLYKNPLHSIEHRLGVRPGIRVLGKCCHKGAYHALVD